MLQADYKKRRKKKIPVAIINIHQFGYINAIIRYYSYLPIVLLEDYGHFLTFDLAYIIIKLNFRYLIYFTMIL